jgi:hypothetical protein
VTRAAALGLRAVRGGGVAVGVVLDGGEPRVVLSAFLATAAEGDRLAFEPYHVAFEMAEGARSASPEVAAAVAEGRRRQALAAAAGLADLVRRLAGGGSRPAAAALLVNRAGWVADLLQHVLCDPAHPPFAEGMAVRDALRAAIAASGLDLVEIDEKSLPQAAQIKLGLSEGGLEARLKALGAGLKPWRKEQKLACLAAWVAAAAL